MVRLASGFCVLALSVSAVVAAPKAVATAPKALNFSGTWIVNLQKSTQSDTTRRMNAGNITIEQGKDTLVISRTVTRQNGETSTSREAYALNGTECENQSFGNRVKKSTVLWADSGKTLVINSKSTFERNGTTTETTSIEKLTLLENGVILSIDNTSTSPRGERKSTFIYDREKSVEKK